MSELNKGNIHQGSTSQGLIGQALKASHIPDCTCRGTLHRKKKKKINREPSLKFINDPVPSALRNNSKNS